MRLAATLVFLLLTASPVAAYLVEVTTSVAVTDAEDRAELESAVMTAVDGVLKDAIGFSPTLVVLTHATLVGNRLYVRLLVADQAGERTIDELHAPSDAPDTTELRI